ncbi:MAG: HAMP domain-containing protein [Bacteroidia bacterium]|nr:HAMP domain-containing protein [Bacteroidia bacterium]
MILNLKKSLSTRIVVNILLFCILLFVICLGTFYLFSKRTIEKKTTDYAIEISKNTVLEAEKILSSTAVISKNYIWLLEKMNMQPDSISNLTRTIVANNPTIQGCAIAFEPNFFPQKGYYFSPYSFHIGDSIVTHQIGNPEYEYFYMDWFQIPKFIRSSYWTEPYYDEGGSNNIIATFSTPFYTTSEAGKVFAGILTLDLSLEWFTEMISSVKILQSGFASVISQHGTIVSHPDSELIMHQTIFTYAKEINSPDLRTIGRDMLAGNSNFVSAQLRDRQMHLFYTPLPTSKWSLIVAFPEKEMYASLKSTTFILVALTLFGLGLLIFLVQKIVRRQIAPLRVIATSAKEVAKGNFSTRLPEIKTEDEMRHLRDSFCYMQKQLTVYIEDLKNTTSAKEKIESELRIAREIQMGMIPKIFPPFPDTPQIDLYAMLQPAKEVGGDLYDFFLIDNDHMCFAIGDVSGKGVPASLFMAVTRTLLRSTAPKQLSTANIVNTLNGSLAAGNESSMFVTFFLGIINLKTGILTYTNAGHNPPIIVHSDAEPEFFETTDQIPIGLFDSYIYRQSKREIHTMDKLLLYTDGITEAENAEKALYSDHRLMQCIAKNKQQHPKGIIEAITEDVKLHVGSNEQSDDLTMLSLIYQG